MLEFERLARINGEPVPRKQAGVAQTYLALPGRPREALDTSRKRDKRALTATIELACEEWLRRNHPDLVGPEVPESTTQRSVAKMQEKQPKED